MYRLSEDDLWDSHGSHVRDMSFNSTQADLLSTNDGSVGDKIFICLIPFKHSSIFQYLNNTPAGGQVTAGTIRTHSSPNIRQSCTSDSATTALPNRTRGFPSTPNVGTPSEHLPPHNINSITNIFPKNISNLSKRDNNDVTSTPSVISENNKIYQKENVWMKRRSSPVSVLELGRYPPSHER